jgi:sec-independent protein translocase protein TatA
VDIGTPELLIAVVVVLLLFGPGQVSKLSRALGASMREFRQAQAEVAGEVAVGRAHPDAASGTGGSVRSPDGGSHPDD